MIRRAVVSVDFEGKTDLPLFRKFIAVWNERHETLYQDGAIITEINSPIEEEFSNSIQDFNRREGTSFVLTRRIDFEFEKSDYDRAEWFRLNINGSAGAGSRELDRETYSESKCVGCGFRDDIRQLRPLVVLRRELQKKDFLHTSHLETLASDRARSVLSGHCKQAVSFQTVDALGRTRSRTKLIGYSQLSCNAVGGTFSPAMRLELGRVCKICGREESRTTGGFPLQISRSSLPDASIFQLNEGLGSSCSIPPRSAPTIVTKELLLNMKSIGLTGYYVQPLLTE